MRTKNQPDYSHSPFKIEARRENVRIYRRLTGNNSIPKDRQYWTLCNLQPIDDGAEIVQLHKLGLLTNDQFHGVDMDENGDGIIDQNRAWHPDAHWYRGEWIDVIESCKDFSPSLVYLDSTAFADHQSAAKLTVNTMMLCPPGTVVVVNVMANDPRSRRMFDPAGLTENVQKQLPLIELEKWDHKVPNYRYSATGKTFMISYIFFKIRG